MRNPLRVDPTRTVSLRKRFVARMNGKFNKLKAAIRKLIVDEDAFGITSHGVQVFVGNTRWRFQSDSEKLTSFNEWLQAQYDGDLLEPGWTDEYVHSGYRQGMTRAYIETKKLGAATGLFTGQTKAEFLETAFSGPVSRKQLELLGTRVFESLKGITAEMSAEMTKTLANGFAHGHGSKKIARDLVKNVEGMEKKRARTLARTETVHAYNEAQLDSFEMMGVEEVGVMAEWSAAGDDRVCPQCEPLDGVVMTVSEARGIIPRHPNCRCAWIPWLEPEKGQKRSQRDVQRSIDRSIRAEKPKASSTADAKRDSRWAGADTEVGPRRKSK